MMKRFVTLLQREWMQHGRGWAILLLLPFVLVVGLGLTAGLQIEMDGGAPGALVGTFMLVIAMTALTLALACGASLLMSPSLARRDVQDRSIEFWVSLPSSHVQSLAATLLMHLVALPLAAVAVGIVGGLLASPLLAAQLWGMGEWFALPWGQLLLVAVALALRLAFGLLLAVLWLSPLILGTMAASAWLKRWGVPVVVGATLFSSVLLVKLYNITVINDALKYLVVQAGHAMVATAGDGKQLRHVNEMEALLPGLPVWLLQDAGHAVMALLSPGFVAAVAGGALMFGLLVMRRQRGA
jgi:ABC-2 type transport system permease protein